MNTAKLVMSAVAATFAVPMLASAQGPAPMPKWDAEHCYGINAAGKNDCAATGSHSCAGTAKRANDPNSWIYVPKGVCEKIAGGSTTAKKA